MIKAKVHILSTESVVKLFSKYSNLCDHDTSKLQTGGREDELP